MKRPGFAVSIFILLIALFLVLYILFIPPEERNKLLEEEIEYKFSAFQNKNFKTDIPQLVNNINNACLHYQLEIFIYYL